VVNIATAKEPAKKPEYEASAPKMLHLFMENKTAPSMGADNANTKDRKAIAIFNALPTGGADNEGGEISSLFALTEANASSPIAVISR
jgi:hypothetical protein